MQKNCSFENAAVGPRPVITCSSRYPICEKSTDQDLSAAIFIPVDLHFLKMICVPLSRTSDSCLQQPEIDPK